MGSDWEEVLLGDIATFSQGLQVDPKNQFHENADNLIRFIRIVDFTSDSEPERYILCKNERYYVTKEDLVMIRYGSQTAGKVVRGKEGVIANNMFKIEIVDENIDNSFYVIESNILVINPTVLFNSFKTIRANYNLAHLTKGKFLKLIRESDFFLEEKKTMRFNEFNTSVIIIKL